MKEINVRYCYERGLIEKNFFVSENTKNRRYIGKGLETLKVWRLERKSSKEKG